MVQTEKKARFDTSYKYLEALNQTELVKIQYTWTGTGQKFIRWGLLIDRESLSKNSNKQSTRVAQEETFTWRTGRLPVCPFCPKFSDWLLRDFPNQACDVFGRMAPNPQLFTSSTIRRPPFLFPDIFLLTVHATSSYPLSCCYISHPRYCLRHPLSCSPSATRSPNHGGSSPGTSTGVRRS
jgi:hypothetical protein